MQRLRRSGSPDLAANLEHTDREYIAACRKAEADAKRGKRFLMAGILVLLVGIILGLVGWIIRRTSASNGAGGGLTGSSWSRICGLTC
jgi:hypothetical protein